MIAVAIGAQAAFEHRLGMPNQLLRAALLRRRLRTLSAEPCSRGLTLLSADFGRGHT